ncbi:hypothetical protein K505DRAFT_330947 [Melanomma pulvis-pyrius CBS 109.77]|uniref:Uncharacterized protein n=1 Tax=Melanomma pulvis-pyrius CBS 109.77 TaxID=1314802 RepID=A0A6A6WNR7_9PLEO|nr:hypothetical protein K505DRAFT_330947 [Melanomma pulvis-pyrius CBS 109.77]
MSKQLTTSEPYTAYRALGCLPFGIEKFDTEDVEDSTLPGVIVKFGELYCRVELPDSFGELCGGRFDSRGALVTHIKKYHASHVAVSPAGKTGNPSMQKIFEARPWYNSIMKRHNELAAAKAPVTAPEIPSPPREVRKRRPPIDTTPVTIPARSERIEPPTYKAGNKKKNIVKGDINFTEAAKIAKKKGAKIPCLECKRSAAEAGNRAPKNCNFNRFCATGKYFNLEYNDGEDTDEEDEDEEN